MTNNTAEPLNKTDVTFLVGIGHTPSGPKFHTSIVINDRHIHSAIYTPDVIMNHSALFILQRKIHRLTRFAVKRNLGRLRVSLVNGAHFTKENFAIPMFQCMDFTLIPRLTGSLEQACSEIGGSFVDRLTT